MNQAVKDACFRNAKRRIVTRLNKLRDDGEGRVLDALHECEAVLDSFELEGSP